VADDNVNIPVVAVNITGGKDENNNAMIDNDNSDAFGIGRFNCNGERGNRFKCGYQRFGSRINRHN